MFVDGYAHRDGKNSHCYSNENLPSPHRKNLVGIANWKVGMRTTKALVQNASRHPRKRGQRRQQRWPCNALSYALTVVCALLSEDSPAWAVRFVSAVLERWDWTSPYFPLPEELDGARSAVPGVQVVARSEDATHGMSSQRAH